MRPKRFKKEIELGPPVIRWLEEHGWDVYQEVPYGGSAADVVAVQGELVAVVEMKLALGLDVIAQAKGWARHANVTWVAVPAERRWTDGRSLGLEVCRGLGIGVLTVKAHHCSDTACAHMEAAPGLRRKVREGLRQAVRPEHKTYAQAGTQSGRRWSDFKETCAAVAQAVAMEPGLTLSELFSKKGGKVKHHYSNDASARACMTRWVARGIVPGVRMEAQGREIRLYPAP